MTGRVAGPTLGDLRRLVEASAGLPDGTLVGAVLAAWLDGTRAGGGSAYPFRPSGVAVTSEDASAATRMLRAAEIAWLSGRRRQAPSASVERDHGSEEPEHDGRSHAGTDRALAEALPPRHGSAARTDGDAVNAARARGTGSGDA